MSVPREPVRTLRLAPAVAGPGVVHALTEGWQVASCAPDRCATPEVAAGAELDWRAAVVPGTVAAARRAAGDPRPEALEGLDEQDHWFRVRFPAPAAPKGPGRRLALRFERLATLSEVWLNGAPILAGESMFARHAVAVDELVQDQNELVLRFRALAPHLARRRPRPRWPVPMVSHRNLRFVRTSLLGRIPGWAGGSPAVGPAGPVEVVVQEGFAVERTWLCPRLVDGCGLLRLEVELEAFDGRAVSGAELSVGAVRTSLEAQPLGGRRFRLHGELELPSVEPWWPHTHGTPTRHPAALSIRRGGEAHELRLPSVGFRSIELDDRDGRFGLVVNGAPVFARGACWMPPDPVRAWASDAELERALSQCAAAGMNTLRVAGSTDYAPARFHELCDAMGILVFQDFMLANLDYPEQDPEFVEAIDREADELLERLAPHCSLAVLCGGSETAQQPAMMGLPPEVWDPPPLAARLGERCRATLPHVPYVPASPFGGALPFRVDRGLAHYFGVGGYGRPASDARTAGVRFASECLAFSQVPEPDAGSTAGVGATGIHTPEYRAAVPRDTGASWDFAEVTDQYVARRFEVDVYELRRTDPERYAELCRATLAELFAEVLGGFRRAEDPCAGALVWTLRDLRPGSGWGLVDAHGNPKSAWFALARACAPRAAWLVDEGLNGLRLHLCNDLPAAIAGALLVRTVRPDGKTALEAELEVELPGRASRSFDVESLLGTFADVSRAYRFGPPEALAVVARWTDASGGRIADAFWLDAARVARSSADPGLRARASAAGDGTFVVELSCERLAQSVVLRAPGFSADDAYFHLAPGLPRTVRLRPEEPGRGLAGRALALNASAGSPLELDRP